MPNQNIEVEARGEIERTDKVIEQLERKDKVGIAGIGLNTGLGIAGGAAAAGTIASAAGATTFLGSTTLASALGGLVVTTTPVGWIVGCAAAAGLLGMGISKMIHSGGRQDQIREDIVTRIKGRSNKSRATSANQSQIDEVGAALRIAIENQKISTDQASRFRDLLSSGSMPLEIAKSRLRALLGDSYPLSNCSAPNSERSLSTENLKAKMRTLSQAQKTKASAKRKQSDQTS